MSDAKVDAFVGIQKSSDGGLFGSGSIAAILAKRLEIM
jgi:hypothetical protein